METTRAALIWSRIRTSRLAVSLAAGLLAACGGVATPADDTTSTPTSGSRLRDGLKFFCGNQRTLDFRGVSREHRGTSRQCRMLPPGASIVRR